jgi:hypothetical protein
MLYDFDKELLVLTVCNKESIPWMDLQKRFLRQTTNSFDHAVFLNDTEYDSDSIIVGRADGIIGGKNQHIDGLAVLMEYARNNHYKNYLVLDSDCFPFKNGWINELSPHLKNYDACSVLRIENCTTFPHPCACFFKDPNKVSFGVRKHQDLLGRLFRDSTCIVEKAFPMIRTNKKNPHLLAAAIYFDMFYHHGCGSRPFVMRTMAEGPLPYYTDIDLGTNPAKLKKRLLDNPQAFIDWLTHS